MRGNRDRGREYVRIMQGCKLSFSGDDKEALDEFLEQLNDCRKYLHMTDEEILNAILWASKGRD